MLDVGRELFEGIEKEAAAAAETDATETDAVAADAAVDADAAPPAFARQLSE